jgi:hypothetical protein
MNPNHELPRDKSDDVLDRMIRAATFEPPPAEARQRVLERAATITPKSRASSWRRRTRPWFLLASAAATVAACAIGFLLLPSASVGWEDVTKAVISQRWIRARAGDKDKQRTIWLSPEHRLWAFRTADWFIFIDGRQRARYEYNMRDNRIAKTAMGEEDARLVSPVDYMSQGLWLFGTERVVSQQRREVIESGKKWVEFELIFWRGETNHGTLRIDPETRLPVYLLLRSPATPAKSQKWAFDYPANGPTNIYALGVLAGTIIDDRMPSEECLQVLRAIAASRARIGDFRLLVAETGTREDHIVWRKGDRWRVDLCAPKKWTDRANWMRQPPDGQGWGDPLAEQLKLCWLGPLYICDGRTVCENANPIALFQKPPSGTPGNQPIQWQRARFAAPWDMLSGEGLGILPGAGYVKFASLVYPDLSPHRGWGFAYDRRPADAPGCVLIKRSAQLATREPTTGHEWYYIDPRKGCAVVRAELFNLPLGMPADPKAAPQRETIRLEDFQQSPQGFWYPGVIHETIPLGPAANREAGPKVRDLTLSVHYHFSFGTELPDSLFVMEEAGRSRK